MMRQVAGTGNLARLIWGGPAVMVTIGVIAFASAVVRFSPGMCAQLIAVAASGYLVLVSVGWLLRALVVGVWTDGQKVVVRSWFRTWVLRAEDGWVCSRVPYEGWGAAVIQVPSGFWSPSMLRFDGPASFVARGCLVGPFRGPRKVAEVNAVLRGAGAATAVAR